MQKEIVTQDNILSLLVARNIMLPWRCQSDLEIVIPYEEYRKYINKMVLSGVCYIDGNIGTYERAINEKEDNLLHRLYLRDVSGSIYNEVCLSYSYGRDATFITTSYETEYKKLTPVRVMELLQEFGQNEIKTASQKLMNQFYECTIDVNSLSRYNLTLYYYSIYLRILTTKSKQRITMQMED